MIRYVYYPKRLGNIFPIAYESITGEKVEPFPRVHLITGTKCIGTSRLTEDHVSQILALDSGIKISDKSPERSLTWISSEVPI